MEAAQRQICEAQGVEFRPTLLTDKAGVAGNVLPGSARINGLRHPTAESTSGWFIWAGEDLGSEDDFFEPLHIEHLIERCPAVLKYLSLPPGWRFLWAPDYEDIWFDPALLDPDEPQGI